MKITHDYINANLHKLGLKKVANEKNNFSFDFTVFWKTEYKNIFLVDYYIEDNSLKNGFIYLHKYNELNKESIMLSAQLLTDYEYFKNLVKDFAENKY